MVKVLFRGVRGVKGHKQGLVQHPATSSNREPLPLLGLKSDGRKGQFKGTERTVGEDSAIETLDLG